MPYVWSRVSRGCRPWFKSWIYVSEFVHNSSVRLITDSPWYAMWRFFFSMLQAMCICFLDLIGTYCICHKRSMTCKSEANSSMVYNCSIALICFRWRQWAVGVDRDSIPAFLCQNSFIIQVSYYVSIGWRACTWVGRLWREKKRIWEMEFYVTALFSSWSWSAFGFVGFSCFFEGTKGFWCRSLRVKRPQVWGLARTPGLCALFSWFHAPTMGSLYYNMF